MAPRRLQFDLAEGLANATLLNGAQEQALVQSLSRYPEALASAATQRAPHTLVYYLRELATAFHTYYNAEQFIVADAPLRNARLALVSAVSAGHSQRSHTAGRERPREHVTRHGARDYKSARRRGSGVARWQDFAMGLGGRRSCRGHVLAFTHQGQHAPVALDAPIT